MEAVQDSTSTEPVCSKPQWTWTPPSLKPQPTLQRKTSISPAVAQGLGAQTPALVPTSKALGSLTTPHPALTTTCPLRQRTLSIPHMQALRKCAQFKAAGASACRARRDWQAGSGAACCPPQTMAARALPAWDGWGPGACMAAPRRARAQRVTRRVAGARNPARCRPAPPA